MKIKIKKTVRHAFLPHKTTSGAAGFDLYAADSGYFNHDYDYVEYGTGVAIQIPKGYAGFLYSRSSISKTPHIQACCVGVLDSDFIGEIKVRFRNLQDKPHLEYSFGDRIAQLIIKKIETIEFEEVLELDTTERGDGAFGSTGK